MNLTRRNILKALGIGAAVSVSGVTAALEAVLRFPNSITVHSINDLPSPVGGVITLESNTTYHMMNTIDLGNTGLVARDSTFVGHHDGSMFEIESPPVVNIKDVTCFHKNYLSDRIRVFSNV